jgi:hypothetical protein
MEMVLWFIAGFAVRGIFSMLFRVGMGVRIMKVAEIRALELLVTAEEHYYQSLMMLDIAAEATGKEQEMKVTKNIITVRHQDWRNKSVEIMHGGLESHKNFVKWRTWKEAMEYLTEVKTDERFMRLLTVGGKKGKKEKK